MIQRAVLACQRTKNENFERIHNPQQPKHPIVERAKIVLLAHEGKTNLEIAEELDTRPVRVSKWRRRFVEAGLCGLLDEEREGRPATYDRETDRRVLALLDEPHQRPMGSGPGHC